MQFSLFSKALMFLSSYTLLFLALLIKSKCNIAILSAFIISFLASIVTLFLMKTKINPDESKLSSINSKNELVTSYLATYILPFLGFNLSNIYDQISLLIIFIVIGLLYIKADLIFINPTLMLFGYNIYDVMLDNKVKRILISKRDINTLRLSENLKYYELHDRYIIIESNEKEE